MTRETKLGLTVALAFLALVGGVLGVKLMQGDGPAADVSAPVAESKSPEVPPPQPMTTAVSPPASAPAPTPPAMDPVVPAVATAPAGGDATKPATAIKPDPDAETAKFTTTDPMAATPAPVPGTAPTTASPPVVLPETPPAPAPAPDTPAEAPKPADPFAVPPPPPGPPPGPVPPLDSPKSAPEPQNEKPKAAPIVLPSGGSVGDAGQSAAAPATAPLTAPPTAAAPLTAPPPAIAPPVTSLSETNSNNMVPASPARPDAPAAGLSDAGSNVQPPAIISRPPAIVSGTNETAAGSMAPAIAAPAPPPPPPVGASTPNSVTFEKAAGSSGTLTAPPAATQPAFTAPRSPEPLAPEVRSAPNVRMEPADPWRNGGNVAAVGLAPPSGATGVIVQAPAAGPPPLVKPVAPGGPKAQSYLVEEYRLQVGDNFEKLSQKYYFSPKYAAALQQYNQDEPLASPGMRANPPMLNAGQSVWMPPARILERDYGRLIPGLQPIPADRGAPGMTTAVRPVAPTGPALYKVRARGESLREIARHTLNDSNQWLQIYNLNTNVKPQPEIPLAPGTILRLPSEAKIDPTDRP